MKSSGYDRSRRTFIRISALTAAAGWLPLKGAAAWAPESPSANPEPLKVSVFSKHLQFLNYRDLAEAAAEIGFDGIDLTVRPRGHVLPERVADDLPRAVEAIRNAQLSPVMMTTAVQDATDAVDRKVLETAAKLGIGYYRMNWLRYPEEKSIPEAVQQFQQTVKALGALNKKLGITGCYQNHSGNLAGASLWELWDIVHEADAQAMGVQYDIRHAVVEGGMSWKNGLRLISPRIKTLAIKDFVWQKRNGTYAAQNVPLGEGMVDFKAYFALLKAYRINVPVSLHYEYPLGGAERGSTEINVDPKVVFGAMKRDLQWLHRMWGEG